MRIDKQNYIYCYPFVLLGCWIAAWLLRTQLILLQANGKADTVYWVSAKIILWVVPVFLLIKLVEQTPWRPFLELTSPLKGMLVGLLLGLLVIALFYVLDRVFARDKHPAFLTLNLALLNGVIVAPLVEEVVFRGFYLRKLMLGGRRFWVANAITTLFFVSMHLPGWYFQGKLNANVAIGPIVGLVFFSLFMGLVKTSTRSLYATIVIHALNNLYSLSH